MSSALIMPTLFTIVYPVINMATLEPPINLYVDGNYQKGNVDGKTIVNVTKINHSAKGESYASDIKDFIQATRPDIYIDICHACKDHVKGLLEEQKSPA